MEVSLPHHGRLLHQPNASLSGPGPDLPPLTGVRAIAAYMVFLHHTERNPLAKELHVGVTLFFVLSGFLIAYKYETACQFNFAWLRQYFQNRFARIFPVYLLIAVTSLLLLGDQTWTTWFLNLTLLKGFSVKTLGSGIAQAWSLTVEECFYASAPVIFLFSRKNLLKPLLFLAALLGGILLLTRIPLVNVSFGPPTFVLLYTFFGRFLEFFAGISWPIG